MSFWDDFNDSASQLADKIISGNITTEELVQDSDCLSLMRDDNPHIIEFLKQPDVYRRLIQLSLYPEIKDIPYKEQYTLAHRANEVLTFRLDSFQAAIIDDEDSLRTIFDYINRRENEPQTHLVVSFFAKIIQTLYNVHAEKIVEYMKDHEFLQTLVSQLRYSALSELLNNLMFNSPPTSHEDFRDLLISSNFGLLLLNELITTNDPAAARNISNIWNDIVKSLREGVYNLSVGEDVLLNQLTAPNVVSKLLVTVLEENCSINTVIHMLDVLIVLTERDYDLGLPSIDLNQQTVDDRLRIMQTEQDFVVEEVVAPFLGKILLLVQRFVVVEDASDIVVSVLRLAENLLNTSSPARRHVLRDGLIEGNFHEIFALVQAVPTWSIVTHSVSMMTGYLLHAAPSEDNALVDFVFAEDGLNLLALILIALDEFLTPEVKHDEDLLNVFAARTFWFRLAERIETATEHCRNAEAVKKAIAASPEALHWNKFVSEHLKPYISANREDQDDNNTTLSSLPCNLSVDEVEIELSSDNTKTSFYDDFAYENNGNPTIEVCTPTGSEPDVSPKINDLSLGDKTSSQQKPINMNGPPNVTRREVAPKKKVLLMGKSGAGKTSMRSIIFANYISRDCYHLGPTLEIEHAHVRFLGNIVLLWDCGGQETFMENYMTSQRDQIFKNVQVLIYVFDVESTEIEKDSRNYSGCLEALLQNSPQAKVFCLVHKMDLVQEDKRNSVFEGLVSKINEITRETALRHQIPAYVQCYRSSIWDETLYKAWSAIVYQLVPNVNVMEHKLKQFAEIMDADEVLLLEKATFLVVSRITRRDYEDDHRFEKVSNIIKQFKLSCSRMGAQFECIHIKNSDFSAFIDTFTSNTYIMSICDGNVSAAAVAMNIKSARKHFQNLDASST